MSDATENSSYDDVDYDETIAPASPFQEKYLGSDARIILAGGAAGSSKSYVGLMRHLRFAEDPDYRSYCIRKNSNAIMASGGLFWEAAELYRRYDPDLQIKLKDQKLVFSSGAEVSFSHYENDAAAMKYQGIQISNIFFDEVTHLDNEDSFWWLWSRLRSKAKNTHSIWLSCNPDSDTWVLKYAKWYLYPEGHDLAGRPDPAKNGVIRYLLRINGEVVWGETPEELQERYGYDKTPISFQGLFGTIEDNPPLMKAMPEYKQSLEALPNLEKERLLYGNWFARPHADSFFTRDTIEEITETPPDSDFAKIVRAYDFASTLPHDGNKFPDYFACVKMGKLHNGNYVILEALRTHISFGEWENFIITNAQRDGIGTEVVIPTDPNAAARAATALLARSISEAGFICRTKRAGQGKLDSFRPFASAAENGAVAFVKGCATDLWNKIDNNNEFMYAELEYFSGKRSSGQRKDDLVDCCSLAFSTLAQRINIPNFLAGLNSANFTHTSPFNKSR